MRRPKLSRSARDLLANRIDTIEKLELAMVLRTARRAMSIDELAERTGIANDELTKAAVELRATLLLVQTRRGELVLVPTDDVRETLDEIAALYASDREQLGSVLGQIVVERMRHMAARTLLERSGRLPD